MSPPILNKKNDVPHSYLKQKPSAMWDRSDELRKNFSLSALSQHRQEETVRNAVLGKPQQYHRPKSFSDEFLDELSEVSSEVVSPDVNTRSSPSFVCAMTSLDHYTSPVPFPVVV